MNVQDMIDSYKNCDRVAPVSAEEVLKFLAVIREARDVSSLLQGLKDADFTEFQIGLLLGSNRHLLSGETLIVSATKRKPS